MPIKEIVSADEAIAKTIFDGATIMVGGFGLVGSPLTLIKALNRSKAGNFTIISNNLGEPGRGLGETLRLNKVKRAIGSFFTSNPEVVEAYNNNMLDVELIPQGTFAEAIRSGGNGIGGFYTPVGVGTLLSKNKELKNIRGKDFVFQEALRADIALIKAYKADKLGNLVYYKTARNFNPIMATAADIVIAEVDEIREIGDLNPEEIITPHLYVDYLVLSEEKL